MKPLSDLRTAKPIDRTAAEVTSSPSNHFRFDENSKLRECDFVSDVPLYTTGIAKDPCAIDYTGLRLERIEIVGYLDMKSYGFKEGGRWSARCDCGRYFIVKSSSIRKWTTEFPDRLWEYALCHLCKVTMQLKKKDFFNRHGKYPDERLS